MKKIFAVVLAVLVLAGCTANSGATSNSNIIDIEEQIFVARTNQILGNPEQYFGRTIRFEGMVMNTSWEDEPFHFVFRNTVGCCGPDGFIGFDVALNDIEPFPDDTWVEVTGVFEEFDIFEGRAQIPIISAISVVEMPERGLEFVED